MYLFRNKLFKRLDRNDYRTVKAILDSPPCNKFPPIDKKVTEGEVLYLNWKGDRLISYKREKIKSPIYFRGAVFAKGEEGRECLGDFKSDRIELSDVCIKDYYDLHGEDKEGRELYVGDEIGGYAPCEYEDPVTGRKEYWNCSDGVNSISKICFFDNKSFQPPYLIENAVFEFNGALRLSSSVLCSEFLPRIYAAIIPPKRQLLIRETSLEAAKKARLKWSKSKYHVRDLDNKLIYVTDYVPNKKEILKLLLDGLMNSKIESREFDNLISRILEPCEYQKLRRDYKGFRKKGYFQSHGLANTNGEIIYEIDGLVDYSKNYMAILLEKDPIKKGIAYRLFKDMLVSNMKIVIYRDITKCCDGMKLPSEFADLFITIDGVSLHPRYMEKWALEKGMELEEYKVWAYKKLIRDDLGKEINSLEEGAEYEPFEDYLWRMERVLRDPLWDRNEISCYLTEENGWKLDEIIRKRVDKVFSDDMPEKMGKEEVIERVNYVLDLWKR